MSELSKFIVTEKAIRPARPNGACFYCHQAVGQRHESDCVLVSKKVKIRMTVEYTVQEPASWDAHQIEFHRNEGSWCASNAIDELTRFEEEKGDCLCSYATFKYIEDVGEPYLKE